MNILKLIVHRKMSGYIEEKLFYLLYTSKDCQILNSHKQHLIV